jgi:gliding motility-associated-like protein
LKPFFKIFLLLSFFLQNRIAEADNCIPTSVTLSRQSEVDSFPINFPGCDVIDGELIISGNDITSLNGLNSIKNIRNLRITNNPILFTLNGLNNILEIDGLYVSYNNNLSNFNALNNLLTCNSLSITNNPTIINLFGLNNLRNVRYVYISDNSSIRNLEGLNSIKNLDVLRVDFNDSLKNLKGLDSLIEVSTIDISFNPELIDLDGLENLKSITNGLTLYYNTKLSTLSHLLNLTRLEGLNLGQSNSLVNLYGLNSLKEIGGIEINNNANLSSLYGLDSLRKVDGNFLIQLNPMLINVDELNNLHIITEDLMISSNSSLEDIIGLSSLQTVHSILISGNERLISLIGLNRISILYTCQIISNNLLINLEGLNGLNTVEGYLLIMFNSSLLNLSGLDNLIYSDEINLYQNSNLQTLNGLNPLLKLTKLEILRHPILKCCYLAKLIIENNPTLTDINIQVNDIGCSSVPEVMALTPTSTCCITSYSNDTIRICQGSTYSVGSHNYTTTGIYRDTIHIGAGCDSIIITNLTVHPTSYQIQNKNLCFGQSFTLSNGRVITTNGTYRDSLQSIFGCDSIIEYRLSFLSNISVNQNPIICKGKTYSLPKGNMVSVSGIYRDTLRASFGCDSIVITNLTVTNPIPFTNNVTICRGKTFKRPNGNIVSTSGIYYDTIKAPNTCDSIVISNLTVTNPTPFNNNVTICSGKTFTRPNGNIVSTAGVYYDTIKAPNTCDSIVITNLTVTPYLQSAQTSTVCLGKSFVLPGGRSVSQNGIYKDTIRNNFGCDSIITTNLTITNPIPFTNTVAICDGQSYTLPNGNKVSRAGIYKDTLRQLNTCDSIIVTNLSVFPNNFTVSLHASDTVESGNGITLLPVLSFGTAVSWNWTPAASLSCTACENPVANPTQNTLYTVTVKATDGCEDTAQTNIIVRRTNVYIPSAFTPNNDGVNDVAEVFAINPKSFSFKIYNRWGELVFESYDVSNKWNGTFKGENCPQDNYSYILDVTMQNDKTYHKQGGILLLR